MSERMSQAGNSVPPGGSAAGRGAVPSNPPSSRAASRQGSALQKKPSSRAGSIVSTSQQLQQQQQQPGASSSGNTHGIGYALEAEEVIRRFVGDKERLRRLSLGDKYDVMKLDDKMLAEAAEDFRQAKLYRQLRLQEGMRCVELEERLKLLNVEEKVLLEERHRLGTVAEQMLRRARRKFGREAEAAKWLEQQKYESDKKFIIDSERERLVRRRRQFELSGKAALGSPGEALLPLPGAEADIILVMTVAVAEGKEEVLTIREGDDFFAVAEDFVVKNRLPPAVIEPLVDEIRKSARQTGAQETPRLPFKPQIGPRTNDILQKAALRAGHDASSEDLYTRLHSNKPRVGAR
ncbi:hypothetical protein DIPPA_33797 [Diplonema papillatum]|nr:hypothetical protein DIPPA_03727 [Diplonema papillatum]KAJ9456498.1 hypothetical protein DIPPA_33797 [Diplonema papillatum]